LLHFRYLWQGNTGCLNRCFSTIGSPAGFKNGLTIGATLNDRQAWLAYYSSSASGVSGGFGGSMYQTKLAKMLLKSFQLVFIQMTAGLGHNIPSIL
jgi:hypothetical protein